MMLLVDTLTLSLAHNNGLEYCSISQFNSGVIAVPNCNNAIAANGLCEASRAASWCAQTKRGTISEHYSVLQASYVCATGLQKREC